MVTTVRATYANGVLTPSEPLDLEEGELVTISIEEAPAVGGGLAAIAKRVKEIHESMPQDAGDRLPSDLAQPKRSASRR